MLQDKNINSPNGGVKFPSKTVITINTPRCTRSIPTRFATGISIGVTKKNIGNPSVIKPSTRNVNKRKKIINKFFIKCKHLIGRFKLSYFNGGDAP